MVDIIQTVDTYTPVLWATMTDDQRYEEYVRVRTAIDKIRQHSLKRHSEYYRLVSELLEEVSADTPSMKRIVGIIKESLERTVKINDDYLKGE